MIDIRYFSIWIRFLFIPVAFTIFFKFTIKNYVITDVQKLIRLVCTFLNVNIRLMFSHMHKHGLCRLSNVCSKAQSTPNVRVFERPLQYCQFETFSANYS
jgi:hypothetical protein